MKPRFQIARWLLCMIALCVVTAVVSIPVISAMHTHAHHADSCAVEHEGMGDGTDDASTCGFCALYAQFTPREALPAPVFSFCTPVTSIITLLAPSGSKAIPTGAAAQHTNRGPPSVFNLA